MWVPVLAALMVIPTHTFIGTGPVLSGAHVTWATDSSAVYTSAPVRRIWRAPKLQPPVFQRPRPIVASMQRVAFIHIVETQSNCGICPYRRETIRRDLWTGPPRGPFKRLNHGLALDVDVDRSRVLYSDTSTVVLGRTLASSDQVEYPDVALAGHYAAWTEVPRRHNFIYTPRTLIVYDLRTRRVAYRLDEAPFGDIDLAPDGTVAFGQDPTPVGGPDGGVGWASVSEPWPHLLRGDAIPFQVRLGAGRIAYFARGALVVQTLDGEVVARREAAYGGFDFDGRRLAYLQSVKVIRVDRLR